METVKKNIIIIGPAHPLRGGLASYNERLAKAFQQHGHTVSIYTFSLQYPEFIFPGTTQYSSEPPPAGIEIHVAINSVNPFNWIKVGNQIKNENPDLIIVRYWLPLMGPCLGKILRIAKKNARTNIVCIADNIIPHEKRFGDIAFTKYFIKPVDAFITMSEKVLADLKMVTNKKAQYVPHPLYDNFGEILSKEVARKKLGIPLDTPLMLFFGFIRKYKGLDILFEAVHILKDTPLSPMLLVAGEFYEDSKPYMDQIVRLGIGENVILRTEFIADSQVKYYMCAADVVVQPYRNATQSGVTPLAYHFEVPMIVTNVGGLPSMVPDNKAGLVAEPDPVSLSKKIIEYFDKGPLFFLPGLKEEKTKYSWDNMVSAILNICDPMKR